MSTVTSLIRRRRARRQRRAATKQRRRVFVLGGLALFLVGGVLPVGGGGLLGLQFYLAATANLPEPRQTIFLDPAIGPSQMLDRTGETLLWTIEDPLGPERAWVSLEDLPSYLLQATLLSEDPDFLTAGARPLGFHLQRLVQNYFYGPLPPDPTLAGRLVRDTLAPPPERVTAADRAREFALVMELTRQYSPQELLEWHLNTNYYGNDAYGVDAASQVYFNKRAGALSVDEAVMLASIPTANQYNPVDNLAATRGRQAALLREMFVNDVISQEVYNQAAAVLTPVQTAAAQLPEVAPAYAVYARQQAEDILDGLGHDGARLVSRGGVRIITALDMAVYEQLACTLDNHLVQLAGGVPASPDVCVGVGYMPAVGALGSTAPDEAAAAVIDVNTGELVAAAGDVTAQTRQPGPVLHPFAYMSGFSSAFYTPATMLLDIPQRFPGAAEGLIYTPENPDSSYRGPLNLRDAMSAGLLPPTVQVANTQGLDNILRTARLMGLRSLDTTTTDLSLLERGGAVSVLDTTYAYSVFASLGEMRGVQPLVPERGQPPREPVTVLRIEDAAGDVLWSYANEPEVHVTPILDDGLAYLVNHILADTAARGQVFGPGNPLETTRTTAAISGEAGGGAWTVGYSPELVVGVWVGRSDGADVPFAPFGLDAAAPAWRALMDYSHDRYVLGASDWPRPENIVEARVCERSGLRPDGNCPERTEIFLENTQPPEVDTYWQLVSVNTQTNQLATANTPANFTEERRYFVPPPDAADWWQATQPPSAQLPTEYDTMTRPDVVSSTAILRPELFDYVTGTVDIRGSMDGENLQYYQLAYGQGLNPSEWIDISGQQTDYTPGQPLGQWDTSGLNGLYNLRLTAVMRDNSIDPFVVQVTVDNTAPTLTLQAGDGGQVFSFLDNQVIPLEADVTDNVAVDRVEFYHNGEFVGTDEEFPYGYEHEILRIGPASFRAVAFDAAGNQASTTLDVEVVRGGG